MRAPGRADVAPWIECLARVGYVAKALLYATIGLLAAAAAFGSGGRATDTRGAMTTVLEAPLGRALLILVAIGLLGYASWRIVAGVADPERRGRSAKALAVRAGYLARGLVHAALAYSALRLARGMSTGGGNGDSAKHWTARAFGLPGGEWFVWLAALAVGGYGAYQVYRAVAAKLGDEVDTSKVAAETGRWVIAVSRFGLGARGVVFIVIGWLLGGAALNKSPGATGGIAEALRAIEQLGRWPFAVVALGLVAYGGYQIVNARYRRIQTR